MVFNSVIAKIFEWIVLNKDPGIFDMRQRQLRHTFQAHESAIKCLTLDSQEEYFVTGSAEGDIKVRTKI